MSGRAVVLSDTHVPDFAEALPRSLEPALRGADLILHAGDVTSADLLDHLAAFAPVHVAIGNGDDASVAAWGALPEVRIEVEGVRIAMLHDSGSSKGRERRMRRRFAEADVVVFGHSHIPLDVQADGVRLFNPGSPTWKRREPVATYGTMTLDRGRVRTAIVPVRPSP